MPEPDTVDIPTDRESAIADAYRAALWEDDTVPEHEIQASVSARYGITDAELSAIYVKVIDYRLATGQPL